MNSSAIKLFIAIIIISIICTFLSLFGYYNWDTILYTSKILSNDISSYISIGRPILFLLGYSLSTLISIFLPSNIFYLVISILPLGFFVILIFSLYKIKEISSLSSYIFITIFFISLPSILIVSTSLLPDIFMLSFTYAGVYFYLIFIKSSNWKYAKYLFLMIFLLAGVREYYVILSIIIIIHNILSEKRDYKFIASLIILTLILFILYHLFLPWIFDVDYFRIRFHHLIQIDNAKTYPSRMGELWNSIKYNFNVLMFIPLLVYSIYIKIKNHFDEGDRLILMLLLSSIIILLIYGNVYTIFRYVVILLIPSGYFIYCLYSETQSIKLKLFLWLILILNMIYTTPAIIEYSSKKKEINTLIENIEKVINQEKNITFYADPKSLESALLKHHFPQKENYKLKDYQTLFKESFDAERGYYLIGKPIYSINLNMKVIYPEIYKINVY